MKKRSNQLKPGWEREFNRRFPEYYGGLQARAKGVKQFISKTRNQAIKETLEKVRMRKKEKIKGSNSNLETEYLMNLCINF